MNISDVNEIGRNIVDSLCKAAEETVTEKSVAKQEWSLSLKNEVHNYKSPLRLKELKCDIKMLSRKLKKNFYGKKANALNLAREANDAEQEFQLSNDYSAIKKTQLLIPSEKLEQHFSEHFGRHIIDPPDEVNSPQNYPHVLPADECALVVDENPPSVNEIIKTVKTLKNGKCMGSDRFVKLVFFMYVLMSLIWSSFAVPKSWLHSTIICLYKNKGDKMEPNNYRGLFITTTCSKVFVAIIVERLRPLHEALLLSTQFGFRANKSTNYVIFVAKNVIDNNQGELFCCFIDLKAAYDWIDRDTLFKIFEIRTGAITLVKLLECTYVGTTAATLNISFRNHLWLQAGRSLIFKYFQHLS